MDMSLVPPTRVVPHSRPHPSPINATPSPICISLDLAARVLIVCSGVDHSNLIPTARLHRAIDDASEQGYPGAMRLNSTPRGC